MKKDFKIARKPGQAPALAASPAPAIVAPPGAAAASSAPAPPRPLAAAQAEPAPQSGPGPATRKTIEVPEHYFYQVKLRALQRRMLEKELWAEILQEYFYNHPS